LSNLLDLDTASMITALREPDGAVLLLDFAAASPSVSQEFAFTVLRHIGVPDCALNSLRKLYDESYC
jgi:hypothetical protein